VGTSRSKRPPDVNDSKIHYSCVVRVMGHRVPKVLRMVTRIPYSEGSLPHKHNFFKFMRENVIKMKNKPDPALLRHSNLSNEIKKGTKIS
jgi:hypothetical protein